MSVKKGNDCKKSPNVTRLWIQINDYEQRAKKTKNVIRKDHFMMMASDLRANLPTNEK